MGVLIDASVFIDIERAGAQGAGVLAERIRDREEESYFVSVVTASELIHGIHRARDPATRARRTAFVEGLLGALPLLPVDIATARVHARLWADLAEAGQVIGGHDLWLAATCIAHDLRLVTANVREFGRVAGLDCEDWSIA